MTQTKTILYNLRRQRGRSRAMARALQWRTDRNYGSILLIVLGAAGALLFTLVSGWFLLGNQRSYTNAANRLRDTQETLLWTEHGLSLLAETDKELELFSRTGEAQYVGAARSDAEQFSLITLRLGGHTLAAQPAVREQLVVCSRHLESSITLGSDSVPAARGAIRDCRGVLTDLDARAEAAILHDTDAMHRSSVLYISIEVAFVALSLIGITIIFGWMIRDAIVRRRSLAQKTASNLELASTIQILKERAEESALLTSSRDELQICTTEEDLLRSLANSVSRLLPGTTGAVCSFSAEARLLLRREEWNSGGMAHGALSSFSPEDCCALRTGLLWHKRPGISGLDCAHMQAGSGRAYLCIPMLVQGDLLGSMHIEYAPEFGAMVENRLEGVRQLLEIASLALASLSLRRSLERQAITDDLTGLYNRHFMEAALNRELSRAARRDTSIAVMMLDVDHFKSINDRFGHATGDAVLRAMGEVLRASVRQEDIASRHGGEEFVVILPDITPATAVERAEFLRQQIGTLCRVAGITPDVNVSASIGLAFFPQHAAAAGPLLWRADEALYRAKHLGRNRVVVWSPDFASEHTPWNDEPGGIPSETRSGGMTLRGENIITARRLLDR